MQKGLADREKMKQALLMVRPLSGLPGDGSAAS